MRLFIAEKPSLARAIAEGLGQGKKGNGYIECGQDIVTWCFGHLLDSAPPKYYDPAYKQWKMEHLPIIPKEFTLLPADNSKEQLAVIKSLLKKCDSVVNAGDPDREGQLLVDEVLEFLKYKGKCKRIWLAALDPISVSTALKHLKDNNEYVGFRNAADTRRIMDWIGGINLTRAMTIFGRNIGMTGILSLGRVQTPTLALVVARDREIENFKPVDYAFLQAQIRHHAGEFTANFSAPQEMQGLDADGRLTNFAIAEKIRADSENRGGKIIRADKKAGKEAPPMPYALSTLQKEASSLYGMGAQDVLNVAQKLYEMKLTTYPRTDCGYLPMEQFGDGAKILASLAKLEYLAAAAQGANPKLKSAAWNTKKITAHHGIIPTGMNAANLCGREKDIFILIAKRYIEQFYPPVEFETTSIVVELENKTMWEANGRVVTNIGWRACSGGGKENAFLPPVKTNDPVSSVKVALERKQTKPPARFTEGSLIQAMSSIHLFVQDTNARMRLKETSGLGTEATRANILETLKKRDFLAVKGKTIISTETGRNVIDLCPPSIKDIVTTALMEDALADIQSGKLDPGKVLEQYTNQLGPMIQALFNTDIEKVGIKKPEIHPCPKCGKPVLRRNGKLGYFWGCTGYPECDVRLRDDKGKPGQLIERAPKVEAPVTGIFKCPTCGGNLKYGISKSGKAYWACFAKSTKHGKGKQPLFFNADEEGKPVI